MPPQVALLLTLGFVACLFLRDIRQRPNITVALWLPLLWMVIIGSRFISEWLVGGSTSASELKDGSPLDAMVFLALIVAGVFVLMKRRVGPAAVVGNNVWLTVFLLYCLVAVLWSDFPLVAFKRWFKVLGHPVMALVVLTEPDPEEAIRRLMKRCAYVLMPVSIMLIKYFPDMGRGYDSWTGQPCNLGITTNKNTLGYDCMVLGLFFIAYGVWIRGRGKFPNSRSELALTAGFLAMTWWLMSSADSQTSTVALFAGAALVLGLGIGWVQRYLGSCLVAGSIVLALGEAAFGIYASVIQGLGRNVTLTDRTEIWQEVLKVDINPLFGAGFESFWLGERLERLWSVFPFQPVQAHNGYIETYLNLGLIGVLLLVVLMVATFWKAKRAMTAGQSLARFRMGLLLAIVLFNYTEASFKALHLVWFAFYLIAIDYKRDTALPLSVPRTLPGRAAAAVGTSGMGRAGVAAKPERGVRTAVGMSRRWVPRDGSGRPAQTPRRSGRVK